MSDILCKILPNHENDLMLLKRYLGTKASVHAAKVARIKSRQLLEQAKRAVEIFIETGEKAALQTIAGVKQ
jgi:hypothetical protein